MNDLTLIIPAKFESESLPHTLRELENLDCKIIISLQKDDIQTINSIKEFPHDIYEQKQKGYGNSITEAINYCKTKYFCIFNADGSFEKNDLIKMYKFCKDYDFVYTSRYLENGGSEDDTLITYLGNKIFSLVGRIFFSLKLNDILYTYVMGRRDKFIQLDVKSNDFRFCVEFPIKMELNQMTYINIPSYEKKRIGGKKKVNAFRDGFLILIEMIKLFFNFKVFRK